jgi:hypothetical protein
MLRTQYDEDQIWMTLLNSARSSSLSIRPFVWGRRMQLSVFCTVTLFFNPPRRTLLRFVELSRLHSALGLLCLDKQTSYNMYSLSNVVVRGELITRVR